MRAAASDLTLEELRSAAAAISANLVELEIDSTRQLLDASPLAGQSAARWAAASSALTELWSQLNLLEAIVRQAEHVRGPRHAAELHALLNGQSIELSSSELPVGERALLDPAHTTERCSPRELLARMSATFDEAKSVMGEIGDAWEILIPRIDEARRLLAEATGSADTVGGSAADELEPAARAFESLANAVTSDPLSVSTTDIDELARELTAIRDELQGVATLQQEFESRILAARELLDRLRATVSQAQTARGELLARISMPSSPAAPTYREELEPALTAITDLAQRGSWAEAQRELQRWRTRASAALDDATLTLEAHRAPIAARNQLRALLDAYQVKAKRLGVLEEPELEEIFTRAHESLYVAPTDLALASQLVRNYQEAVNGLPRSPEARS
jgi:hypothetical protein